MSYGGNDMVPEPGNGDPVSKLRWLAVSDPKQARTAFREILNAQDNVLNDVLASASRPGDGRLRQMIAMVFKTDPKANNLESWLRQWLDVESDEFTKGAIQSALSSRVPENAQRPTPRNPTLQVVEAYRYVAERLCHRVRNSLTLPNAQIKQLEHLTGKVSDPALKQELTEILAACRAGLLRVSRTVEFDTGDDYLAWQTIALVPWIEATANEFVWRTGQASLSVVCAPAVRRSKVRATRFLLETLFGNLWANAIQAVDAPCKIEIQCALAPEQGVVDILVLDNGPGFPEKYLETAFQQMFSTKAEARGRGLLEVGDAVLRLQGTVELSRYGADEHRIRIRLPVENS